MKYSVTVTGTFEAAISPNGINISLSLKENEGGEKNADQNEASSGESADSGKKQSPEEVAAEVTKIVTKGFETIGTIGKIIREASNNK